MATYSRRSVITLAVGEGSGLPRHWLGHPFPLAAGALALVGSWSG